MQNAERFLTAYNRIDHTMQEIVGAKHYISFSRLLDQTKKNNSLIRKYEEDLRSYAELRNAIVHNRTSLEYVIAEPHIEVVEKIEKIDKKLAQPQFVGQLFKKRVHTFQLNDSLKDILDVIKRKKFSQFPVYEGKEFKGLVTTIGITNWLATMMDVAHFPKQIPTLAEILNHEENTQNYQFISSSRTVYDVEEIFKHSVSRGKRLEVLLITEHGRPHQKLIGIVSPIDIMKVD